MHNAHRTVHDAPCTVHLVYWPPCMKREPSERRKFMSMRTSNLVAALIVGAGLLVSAQGPRRINLGDWPEARGPNRDGISAETGLPDKWALNGQNFLWRAPFGGRSAPIVMGNRLYVQNPAEQGATLQERVMAL